MDSILKPLLSVVIPTCHRNDLLAKCLDRLAPGKQAGGKIVGKTDESSSDPTLFIYEVIVTDDGTRSTAQELIADSYPWVKWIEGPRRGPAANRNCGANNSAGKWVAFVDDDCVPDLHWLDGYSEAISLFPNIRAFEGAVTPEARAKNRHDEAAPLNSNGGCFWSCNILLDSVLFAEMNGFDEAFHFPAMEDVEFRTRLVKATEETIFVEKAAVCHPWRPIFTGEQMRARHRSVLLYYKRHPDLLPNLAGIIINIFRSTTVGFYRLYLRNIPTCGLRGFSHALRNFCLDLRFEIEMLGRCFRGVEPWVTNAK